MLCLYNFDELNAYILSLNNNNSNNNKNNNNCINNNNNNNNSNNNNNNSIIKAQKNSIILKVFGTKGFRLQDLKQNSHSCTRFACRKHLNGFRRQKKKSVQ